MKKRKSLLWLMSLVFVLFLGFAGAGVTSQAANLPRLKVKGTKLVYATGKNKDKTVQLKGVSTHGLSWYPQYVNQKSFKYMKKNWKINTVRLAMYTAEDNGYCVGGKDNQKKLENLIDNGVKYATNAGLYVIIDWHILSDSNPKTYQKDAVAFFKKMAKKYKNHTNVIYEICNEPNSGTSWETIRSYAQKVTDTIRKQDKNAIIVVGTPTWSQDVDAAAKKPLKGKNIMYTLHFYAGTHGQWLRDKAQTALNAGLPLFVTEFAICDASGNGSMNKTEGTKWLNFLKKNKIPFVAWNLSNKSETSSLIASKSKTTTDWKDPDLTDWAKWLLTWMK